MKLILTLRLLGPIDIRFGERPAEAACRDKGLLLLAYLAATAGRKHPREDLADLFWPRLSRERGLHNLRQTLLRLRGLLSVAGPGPSCLLAQPHAVAFDRGADYWLDLEPFCAPVDAASTAALERRAALYRGHFMEDLAYDVGERFAQWVAQRRADCLGTALAVEATLAARHEQAGRLDRAVEHARRCVALDPLQEAGQRRLMRLLAMAGQADVALHQFDALRDAVRREMDGAPEAETLALADRIRSGALAPARPAERPPAVERRRVTALDCGLSCCGSEDPEALAAALAGPSRLARGILEAAGGHVAAHSPGGLTAFFGWPVADERAARHAARAALALQGGLARAHPGLAVTVGLHDGTLLDGTGEGGGWLLVEQAMRLRLAAPAGTVLVGARLRERLRAGFDLRSLRDAAGRLAGWQLLAERDGALAGDEAHPLEGRQAPLAALTQAWQAARAGGGLRVAAITGEAGIGKSRLAREFVRAVGGGVLWGECDPQDGHDPLQPVLRMLRRALALPAEADAAQAHARLAEALAPDGEGGRAAARLLVPLFCPGEPAPAPERRAAVMDALGDLLARLAGPAAALVLDDIHWADASSLDLLQVLAQRHAGRGMLLVLTARRLPTLPPGLAERLETLALAPLDAQAAARLAAAVSGRPTAVAGAAPPAAEGIPLFIVELARMQVAAEGEAIPASLQDLLAARLEQAGDDKPLLQAAAVIGREFGVEALRELMEESGGLESPLARSLDRLAEANLIERDAGGAGLRFSHALLQRAAYESLPRARRAELHRRCAGVLQGRAGGPAAPAAIAWHLTEGGLPGEAAEWWLRAAQAAAQLAAYAETVQLAQRALAALAGPAEGAGRGGRDDTELGALLLAAYARVALGGYYDRDAQAFYGRARELIRGGGVDARQTLGVLRGHWFGASSRASYREALALAEEMIAIADAAGQDAFRGIGRYLAGNAALWLGRFEQARALLEEAVAMLARAPADPGALTAHDQDFEATATGYLGWAHWYLGRADRALALGRQAIELARRRGHLLTLLHTAMTFCSIGMGCHAVGEVRATAEEIVRLAQPRELVMWADMGRLLLFWARSHDGSDGSADAAPALERLCTVYPGGAAGFQVIFADACLARGDCARARAALAALDQSLRTTEAGGFAVSRLMLEGGLAQREQRPRDAAARYRLAIQAAAAQGSPTLEAQAWTGLCRASPGKANRAGLAAALARCSGPVGEAG